MLRSVKLTTKFMTKRKKRAVVALLQAYRKAVNFYIRSCWITPGGLDKETFARLPASQTKLSSRYKSAALHQALAIIRSTKASAKSLKIKASMPVFLWVCDP